MFEIAQVITALLIASNTMIIPGPGIVLTDNLRLRDAPSLKSQVLAALPCGTPLEVLGFSIDRAWYRVKVRGRLGFVYARYVGPPGAPCGSAGADYAPTRFVTASVLSDRLNVRSEPSLKASVLAQLARGDKVDVIAVTPDRQWLMIRYKGKEAFVYAAYTDFSPP